MMDLAIVLGKGESQMGVGQENHQRSFKLARGALVALFGWLVVLLAVRFLWLENGVAPFACGATFDPALGWPCLAKFMLVQAFIEERAGWLALALALPVWWRGHRGLATAALWIALFATVFYGATTGVIAALMVLPGWLGVDQQRAAA